MHAALDYGFVLGAHLTNFTAALCIGAGIGGSQSGPMSRLHVHAASNHHRAKTKEHGAGAPHGAIWVGTERSRQKTQASRRQETSKSNQPASNLQHDETLFGKRNQERKFRVRILVSQLRVDNCVFATSRVTTVIGASGMPLKNNPRVG